jgi:hypothetical protein
MTQTLSPWAERFLNLADPTSLALRSRVSARTVHDLGSLSTEAACDCLKAEFERIFFPTKFCVNFLVSQMERAASYAVKEYPDERHFLARCYGSVPNEIESAPICLTGLAGVGKSQLRKAFFRVLPPDQTIPVSGHGEFPITAAKLVVVRSRMGVLEALRALCRSGLPESSFRGEPAWLKEAQQWLYQTGVCMLPLDELQFLTLSERANSLLVHFLMTMCYLGPPVFFTCNYSLGHRLMSRRQEDKQRLLTKPYVLLPDAYDSVDWNEVLKEFAVVAPQIFCFDFVANSRDLWNLTAGIKRILSQLLILAYRQVRREFGHQISFDDVRHAYGSSEFYPQRVDVEHLFTYGTKGHKSRQDLICPFPIETPEAENYANSLRTARQKQVADRVTESVMSKQERESLKRLEVMLQPKVERVKRSNVVKLKPSQGSDLDVLIAAGQKFRDDQPN